MGTDKRTNKRKSTTAISIFDRLNTWLDHKERILFIIISVLCLLFSFALFNAKVTEMNDDSLYIEAGYMYATNFFNYFYTLNAPLYPMFLGLIIRLVGVKLILLKLFSVIFNYLHLYFLYKAFKNRIPNLLLFSILFIVSINHLFQYFASVTFSEPMFLFFQALFFFRFVKLEDSLQQPEISLKNNLKNWLWIGFMGFLLSITRNVAGIVIPAVLLFYLFRKQFLNTIYFLGAVLVFRIPYEIIKKTIWSAVNQYGNQTGILLQKDPYDSSKGQEDFMGFVARLMDNCNLYLSKRFFQIIGFMSENSVTVNSGVTVIVIGLLLWGIYRILKSKHHLLLMAAFYMITLMGATFFVLQARWDQPRMVMIHVPFILLIIFYGLYDVVKNKSSFSQWLLVIIPIIIIMISVTISSSRRVIQNVPVVTHNLKGDIYYGYTPDWINYLKMSQWCGENLTDSAQVACRKAPMSFVYGGKQIFYPVYKAFSTEGDTVLATFKKNKVTHIMIASLRMNPAKADGNVINTMHRLAQAILEKHPNKLKLVHQIPAPEVSQLEPTYLYEIVY